MSERLRTCIIGVGLGFLLSLSCMACLVAGLSLTVNLRIVAFWCLLSAVICAFCCGYRLGLVPAGLWALCLGYLWQSGLLASSFGGLLYEISYIWHDICGWQILRLGVTSLNQAREAQHIAVYLLGSALSMVTAWSVTKGQSTIPAMLLTLPAPVLVLLILGCFPGILWVFLLLASCVLLLLASGTRYGDEKQGNRVTIYGALPVMLAVAILLACIPRVGYTGNKRAEKWADVLFHDTGLKSLWDSLTEKEIPSAESVDGISVNLDELGQRFLSSTEVMSVTAGYTGTLYLRGASYDTYDGKTWTNSGETVVLPWPNSQTLQTAGEVMISTEYAHRMMYLPYYVRNMNLAGLGRGMENEYKLNYYTIACARMPGKTFFEGRNPDPRVNANSVSPELMRHCTALPESTRRWAKGLLSEILGDTVNYYHVAQKICRYVRTGARYDLNPQLMGRSEKDFARWFIERSETGYCVHYATAATVLLKAADIPARYVSGYMVEVTAGVPTPVRQSNAHAWVEYWLPGFGWTILEATPADESEYIPRERPNTPTEPVKENEKGLPDWIWILVPVCAVVGLGVYHTVPAVKRKRRLTKGSANSRLLARWAELEALVKLMGDDPSEELRALAEKAKFSPYTMTEEELLQMDSAMDGAKAQLRTRNIFLQLKWLHKRNRV